jgi:hypothetical protein
MKNRQSTCKYTINVQFTDLEKLLSHEEHGNGGGCFSADTTPELVYVQIVFINFRYHSESHLLSFQIQIQFEKNKNKNGHVIIYVVLGENKFTTAYYPSCGHQSN